MGIGLIFGYITLYTRCVIEICTVVSKTIGQRNLMMINQNWNMEIIVNREKVVLNYGCKLLLS